MWSPPPFLELLDKDISEYGTHIELRHPRLLQTTPLRHTISHCEIVPTVWRGTMNCVLIAPDMSRVSRSARTSVNACCVRQTSAT